MSLDLERDGADWPHRGASRLVGAGGVKWHVQEMGEGSPLLLLHGAGASTHSWRDFAPLMARDHRVLLLDLPGHGFSRIETGARASSLPGMASALAALLRTLAFEPAFVVGHSAGAAIMLRLAIDGAIHPRALVSLNGALAPFRGLAGQVFPPMARLLALNPLVPSFFAWSAGQTGAVERLIGGTGSRIDDEGKALYARLLRDPGHVRGALTMMANWDLAALENDMPRLNIPLLLIAASEDRTIPPTVAVEARSKIPGVELLYLRRLGHLAHEEKPEEAANAARTFFARFA